MTDDQNIEDFLAAPDTVRKNEAERTKMLRRKAHEKALEEQEKRRKSPERPTTEDLLADMVRVAEDPETNPYHADRTLSRKRYKRFGWYPTEHVDREFGQFEHAKQVAGLADRPGTRSWKAHRAQKSREEHAGRYQERYMRGYRVDASTLTDVELMLSISDTHSTFLDPFTWHCFLRAIQEMKPDCVYLNGDILEGAQISRHPKIPGWTVPFQLELDFLREMFVQLRQVFDGRLIWGAGNHGLDRWAMFLTQVAPQLAGMRSLRIDQLLDMDGLGVELSQSGTWASPAGTEDELPGTKFGDGYVVYHGTALGQTPYLTELRDHGLSGQSGHVHRAGMAYATTEDGGARSWMSTPMGCLPRAARSYLFRKRNTGWQTGFGVCWMHPGGRVHQYPVVTSQGVCMVEGMAFDNPGLPEPDPEKLWLPEFEVPS